MTIQFHDPRGIRAGAHIAYSLGINLDQAPESSVGLLANGFPDSEAFLDAVAVSLNERYPYLVIERFNKGNASITAPDSLMDDIASRCDALIAAYGH